MLQGSQPTLARETIIDFFGLMLDTVDGMVARRTGPTSWSCGCATVMRTGYAVTKVVTFCALALAQAFSGFPPETAFGGAVTPMMGVLRVTAWVAVLFCVFRGLPVIISALRRYWGIPSPARAAEG